MEEIAIKIEHVSKQYRLGAIGGGTLQGDLQSWWARVRGKEDPNSKIGADTNLVRGQRFLALDDISFEVKKGEAVGIIGHNGAGKSTLLKLLSRVTAPTSGTISYNGRIASMLEVGTGFHPELTGRENVYMNGAILGMTKAEIDKKFDQIVEFAEMEKFIDTPVKRYSSGMYVKLAFSVAAHLDSEIMVMDEVLAVGDMKFQKKCLDKMRSVAELEGRTVLYVSHNMNTIRQLCDRCLVFNHGRLVFNGDVETAISIYLGNKMGVNDVDFDLANSRMDHLPKKIKAKMTRLQLLDKEAAIYAAGEDICFRLTIRANEDLNQMRMRFELQGNGFNRIGTAQCNQLGSLSAGESKTYTMRFKTDMLTRGKYICLFVLHGENGYGNYEDYDAVYPAFSFEIEDEMTINWNTNHWGNIRFPDICLEEGETLE